MALTLLDIYNYTTGQSWSMFDTGASDEEEFESSVLSSIQKALVEIWCSYNFPFRLKTDTRSVFSGQNNISAPPGIIVEDRGIKLVGGAYLNRIEDYKSITDLDTAVGTPTDYYLKGEKIYLYPSPDGNYDISIDYHTLVVGVDEDYNDLYTLKLATDTLDIPEQYERLFLNALATKAMAYAIASKTDENYTGYEDQYQKAYDNLIDSVKGISTSRKVSW